MTQQSDKRERAQCPICGGPCWKEPMDAITARYTPASHEATPATEPFDMMAALKKALADRSTERTLTNAAPQGASPRNSENREKASPGDSPSLVGAAPVSPSSTGTMAGETPRTDALAAPRCVDKGYLALSVHAVGPSGRGFAEEEVVPARHARQLERELADRSATLTIEQAEAFAQAEVEDFRSRAVGMCEQIAQKREQSTKDFSTECPSKKNLYTGATALRAAAFQIREKTHNVCYSAYRSSDGTNHG